MTKNNVKNLVTRRIMAFIIAFAMVMTSTVTLGVDVFEPEVAEAATTAIVVKSGNQTLSVNEGLAVLDVDGKSYQLSKLYCVDDAAFDSRTGKLAVTLWKEGMLFIYCYDFMSNTSTPFLWDSGVTQLTTVGSEENRRVTGYDKASGHYQMPTLEQFQTKLSGGTVDNKPSNPGSDNNNSNNNNQPNNPQNPTNPGNTNTVTDVTSVTSNGVTVKETATKTYTLYTGKEMVSAGKDASGIIWSIAKDGTRYYWIPGSSSYNMVAYGTGFSSIAKDSNNNVIGFYETNGTFKNVPTKSEILATQQPSTTASNYSATLEGTTAYLMVQENGVYRKIKVAEGKISAVGYDSLGTIYIYYTATLKAWNYPLQKAETTKKLVTISSKCSGLAYASAQSNQVTGYFEGGVIQPLWSLDQMKIAISNTAAPKQYNKFDHVTRNGTTRYLRDSNNKTISKAKRKDNKIYWNDKKIATGKKTNKIQSISFIKGGKGKGTFRCKKGQCYIISTSGKWKLWRSDVKSYVYDEDGFITHVKTKSGKKVKMPTSTTTLKGTTQPTIVYLDFFYKSAA